MRTLHFWSWRHVERQDNARMASVSIGVGVAVLSIAMACPAAGQALPVGAGTGTWRDRALRTTLRNGQLEATFQGGLLVALRHRGAEQPFLQVSAPTPTVPLFGARTVDLAAAKVRQHAAERTLSCRYSWPDESTWDLSWELEPGGDLVLRTSARVDEPVSQMDIIFPGCDLTRHAFTTVTNFCVGTQAKAPWTGMIGDPKTKAYRREYVQPIVALFEGRESGWFVEGREMDVGPANVLAFGRGQTVDVVLVRGFAAPTRTPRMFEIRLRPYRGSWHDAVDPYVEWLEAGLGLVPLERKPLSWVRDVRAQSATEVGRSPGIEALAQQVEPSQTLVGKIAEHRKYPFDVNWPNYELTQGARTWIARTREFGFHVAAHFNTTGIDLAYPDLIKRFRPGLKVTGTSAEGNVIDLGTWALRNLLTASLLGVC